VCGAYRYDPVIRYQHAAYGNCRSWPAPSLKIDFAECDTTASYAFSGRFSRSIGVRHRGRRAYGAALGPGNTILAS
jgi:hypothetical protein